VNPLFFTVPAELLRPGANEVLVRVLTHIGAPGYLRGVEVGPERALRPVFDRTLGLQLGLTQVIAATTLSTGLLILLVAIGRPQLRDSIWLAIGLVVWSWGSADFFFKRIFLPTRLWEWTVGIAPLWAVVCFGLGFHRVLAIVRPRHEAVLVAIASVVSAGILIAPPDLWVRRHRDGGRARRDPGAVSRHAARAHPAGPRRDVPAPLHRAHGRSGSSSACTTWR
jgi:hypothetical protein